ncbi:hypothetical protein PI124_g13220 [Phytophthora idaei]|nr:hypothetical protein PI125_g12768 [Phytophthora idaei]KAG3149814.1 hypothetical protein PI126_g11843 [Phytophthora idaei]KAG3241929.1 hypothetical protein PI124_g13220 [Phytophthora idaei]
MASPPGSSSCPRRQSLLDVASEIIASFRERPSGDDVANVQHENGDLERVLDEGSGVGDQSKEEKVEDNDGTLSEPVPTDVKDQESESDNSDKDDSEDDDSDEDDCKTDHSDEDEKNRAESESVEPIGTEEIDPLILETEQGVDASEESVAIDGIPDSGVSSVESSNPVETNTSTSVSGYQGVGSEQGGSPRKMSLFAQAASSMMAVLREGRSSLSLTPVASDTNSGVGSTQSGGLVQTTGYGANEGRKTDEHSQSNTADGLHSSADEAVSDILESDPSVVDSSPDVVARDELIGEYKAATIFHGGASHSEINVEGSDNSGADASSDSSDEEGGSSGYSIFVKVASLTYGGDHGAGAVTRNAEHVLDLQKKDNNHVSISILDSPKPPFKKANSKALGLTSLPLIGETTRATVGVYTDRPVKGVGTALLEVLSFLPVTKMTNECLEKLNSQSTAEGALDLSLYRIFAH